MSEQYLTFEILKSPYYNIRIPITPGFKIIDLKNEIINNYNIQQTEFNDPNLISIIGEPYAFKKSLDMNRDQLNIALNNVDTDLYEMMGLYTSVTISNGNIDKRLNLFADNFNPIHIIGFSEALFKYDEYISFTRRIKNTKEEIISFHILHKNKDGSINIQLTKPTQLNTCCGPTLPMKFYRLWPNKKVSVYYYETRLPGVIYGYPEEQKDIYFNLINDIEECTSNINCTFECIEREEYECVICLDKKAKRIFLPCGHVCTCFNCSSKVKSCPLCRSNICATYNYIDLKNIFIDN